MAFSYRATADGKVSNTGVAFISVGEQGPAGPAGPAGPPGTDGTDSTDGEPALKLLLVLGSDRFAATAGKKLSARFAASAAGELTATLKGTSKTTKKTKLTKKQSVEAGIAKAAFKLTKKKKPIPAGAYRLELGIEGHDGQSAADSAKVKVKKPR